MATPVQIAHYATKYLFFGNSFLDRNIKERVTNAVAIALAESGGNEGIVSDPNTNGTIDVGLWQINSTHRDSHPEWTTTWLQNPDNNAKAMAALSNRGTYWIPWSAYKNGAYRKHLETAKAAVEGITLTQGVGDIFDGVPVVGDAIDAAQATADTLASIADPLIKGAQWVGTPKNWIRIAEVVGGIALGLVALGIVARPSVKDTLT